MRRLGVLGIALAACAPTTTSETRVDADAQDVETMRADMLKDFIGTLTEVHGGKQ